MSFEDPSEKRSFTDANDRVWPVDVDVVVIGEIRKSLNMNLLDVLEDKAELLVKIHDDAVVMADVLWLCVPEESRQGLTQLDLCRGLRGDALQRARDALFAAIGDFFPDPERRIAFRKTVWKMQRLAERMLSEATEAIDGFDPDSVQFTDPETDAGDGSEV